MKKIEWETIDESLFEEAGFGSCVQVRSNEDYIGAMILQNQKVIAYLRDKYPDRYFRLSSWNTHDFGQYREIEEAIEYEDEDEE